MFFDRKYLPLKRQGKWTPTIKQILPTSNTTKGVRAISVMFLAENLNIQCSASIAFDGSSTLWAKPKPLYNRKRARVQGKNPYILALVFLLSIYSSFVKYVHER